MIEPSGLLPEVVAVLAVAALVLYVCRRSGVPAIVGLFAAGLACGPHGLALVSDRAAVETLADVGVIALLFTIGLELSLKDLVHMRRAVVVGGGLQISLTWAAASLAAWCLGMGPGRSLFLGMLAAHSSTAVMLAVFQERNEADSPSARLAFGMAVAQDLAAVPMMLLVPSLGDAAGDGLAGAAKGVLEELVLVTLVVLGARSLAPRLLGHAARTRSGELFMLVTVVVCLGTAWLTSRFGLSLALGAFVAGLVLAESEYSHQVISSMRPFRDVFSTFFFLSIGMLMDVRFFAAHAPGLLGLIALVVLGKTALGMLAAWSVRTTADVALMVGLTVAHIGEFSFILARAGIQHGVITPDLEQLFLAASVGTLVVAPFLIAGARRVADLALHVVTRVRPGAPAQPAAQAGGPVPDGTVIVGFGPGGRHTAKAARLAGIPYQVIELNASTVEQELARGEPILFGDASREEILLTAGVATARVVLVTIPDPVAARRITAQARRLSPGCSIVVRTRFMSEMRPLYELGADDVIPEEHEAAVELLTRVLAKYLVPRDDVERIVAGLRSDGYSAFRAQSFGQAVLRDLQATLPDAEITAIRVSDGAPLAGSTLAETDLRRRHEATVLAIRRGADTIASPAGDLRLERGDVCVLLVSRERLPDLYRLFRPPASA